SSAGSAATCAASAAAVAPPPRPSNRPPTAAGARATRGPEMRTGGDPDSLSAMKRTILAIVVAIAATFALAWWLKGDWEMGWLLWMIVVPVAGSALGLLAAVVLRGHVGIVTAAGTMAAVIALWAAIATPHQWPGADQARAERRAAALADSTH